MTSHHTWHALNHYEPGTIPADVKPWLSVRGSLRLQLKNVTKQQPNLTLLSETWEQPSVDESAVLGLAPKSQAMVREIQITCDDTICVYARSVIPQSTWHHHQAVLETLHCTPLGTFLFSYPNIRRSEFEVTGLTQHSGIYRKVSTLVDNTPATLWGRRSIFYPEEQPILVCEFFPNPLRRPQNALTGLSPTPAY